MAANRMRICAACSSTCPRRRRFPRSRRCCHGTWSDRRRSASPPEPAHVKREITGRLPSAYARPGGNVTGLSMLMSDGIQVIKIPLRAAEDLDSAFSTMTRERVDGFLALAGQYRSRRWWWGLLGTWRAPNVAAPYQRATLTGQEHGRTIPLAELARHNWLTRPSSGRPPPPCFHLDRSGRLRSS